MLQSVLKDHEEVNKAINITQLHEKNYKSQLFLPLNKLVSVLLSFKKAIVCSFVNCKVYEILGME